jgi:hypothetical protein
MKAYFGFDDTDDHDSPYGTGKLVRWFQRKLPAGCTCLGVVRQQLFVSEGIPYTSHNSSACLIAEVPDTSLLDGMITDAVAHIIAHSASGSDPGLCVATEMDTALDVLVEFGRHCTHAISTQKAALEAARNVHLTGHGGTNDGIIGATAAVGLTLSGWAGRYIEFDNLRELPVQTRVGDLRTHGIDTLSIDRDARIPSSEDIVNTHGWVRPRRVGHRPVLLVKPLGDCAWENIDCKRKKKVSLPLSDKEGSLVKHDFSLIC